MEEMKWVEIKKEIRDIEKEISALRKIVSIQSKCKKLYDEVIHYFKRKRNVDKELEAHVDALISFIERMFEFLSSLPDECKIDKELLKKQRWLIEELANYVGHQHSKVKEHYLKLAKMAAKLAMK